MPEPRIYTPAEIQEAGNDLKDKMQYLIKEFNTTYGMIIFNIIVQDVQSGRIEVCAKKVNDPLLVAQKIIPADEPVIRSG